MVKTNIIPLTKPEMARLLEAAMDDEFWFMFFNVAKKTGRRLGEYYDVKVKDLDFERKIMMTKVFEKKKEN